MKTIREYESYILTTMSILQNYYDLPELHTTLNNVRNNCFTYNVCAKKAIRFSFDISRLKDLFVTKYKNNFLRLGNKKTFKSFLFAVILHELGHYKQFIQLGADNYHKKYDYNIPHDTREIEIEADKFSRDNYNEASYFIEECLK